MRLLNAFFLQHQVKILATTEKEIIRNRVSGSTIVHEICNSAWSSSGRENFMWAFGYKTNSF